MLSGCGEKGSEGLEYKSNGDGTCSVIGLGSCTDEEIVIPAKSPDGDKVTAIAAKAFYDTKIRSVKIANGVEEIGSEAFSDCQRLETVSLPKTLVKIDFEAFYGCDLITEIKLPDSLEEFGVKEDTGSSWVFRNCESLKKINIPKNVKCIYDDMFGGTALTDVEIKAEFKYGLFKWSYGNWADGPAVSFTDPTLYLTQPSAADMMYESDLDDVVELNEDMKNLLYQAIFGEDVKVNGKSVETPKTEWVPGVYGDAEDSHAYRLTEEKTIECLRWDSDHGRYEVHTDYDTEEEEIFSVSYNEDLNCFMYTDFDDDSYQFVIFGNYLFINHSSHYTLNEQCAD